MLQFLMELGRTQYVFYNKQSELNFHSIKKLECIKNAINTINSKSIHSSHQGGGEIEQEKITLGTDSTN